MHADLQDAIDFHQAIVTEGGKALVGYEYIRVRAEPPALQKSIPGIYCDLSAIAKGWGVDQVADLIESWNFHNYLVEIGGEIRAKGTAPLGRQNKIFINSERYEQERIKG
jgi:thiamine biosynthesis lipoprotein